MVSGIDYEFELAKQVIKTIELEDINNFFLKFYQPDDRIILIKGPEKYKDLITKEIFLNYESEIAKTKTLQADFTLANKKLINKKLTGSKIVKEIKYPNLDITELHLANGVKVFLKPTKFKEKEFSFNARSPGGFSHIPLPKLYSAQNAQRMKPHFQKNEKAYMDERLRLTRKNYLNSFTFTLRKLITIPLQLKNLNLN
jgi:zinc protease